MAKLIVLSDRDILGYLSGHGIYPAEFYTDLEVFKERSIFFEDSCILYISFLSGRFSQKMLKETLSNLMVRAEDAEDKGVVRVLLFSMIPFRDFEDYYLFENDLRVLRVMSDGKEKGTTTLVKLLTGCVYNIKNTEVYLSEVDYGINREALSKVRTASENKDPMLDLVRIPKFEDL